MTATLEQKQRTFEQDSDPAEYRILETVFRYQLANCQRRAFRKMYFLSFKGADPPDEVMERFKPYGNSVRKRSALKQFYNQREPGVAVILAIESMEPESDSVVNVRATCGLGILDGSSYLYRVKRVTGKWKVMKRSLIGVG